jgi:hypothetical protein
MIELEVKNVFPTCSSFPISSVLPQNHHYPLQAFTCSFAQDKKEAKRFF